MRPLGTSALGVVLVGAVTAAALGCGVDDGETGNDGPTATQASVEGSVNHEVLAVVDRSVAPEVPGGSEASTGRAVVVDDLVAAWPDWGPATSDPPAPPALSEGARALLVWVPGTSPQLSELSEVDGQLQVGVVVTEPSPGCGTDAERHGSTLVIELVDPTAPGEADVEVETQEVAC